MPTLYGYDSFWVLLLLASAVPVLAVLTSKWVAPVRRGPEKYTSYESGIEPMGESWIQFQIRYYMFALVFVLILVIGLIYAWRKGALEWS
jgi:NAD(P)H-quinone oxidoreductase subunit 3